MTNELNDIPDPAPRKLRLKNIHAEPSMFQPRSVELDHGHVADLAKVLSTGRALDPLHVRIVGDGSFTVLDGHHSLAAYREAGWTNTVPVLAYNCSIAQGQRIAARENSKARLQMTDAEKRDWAWRLTVEQPELPRSQVSHLCNVGTATVSRMRRVLKSLRVAEVDPPATWRAAQIAAEGDKPSEWSEDQRKEWRKAAFAKLKRNIARDIVQYSVNDPVLVLEVVQEAMGKSRFATGAEYLGFHEGEIDEYTGTFTPSEEAPDDGEDDSAPF